MAAGDGDIGAARLDAFVDAAFAFALTLLVIGSSNAPESYADLINAVRGIPAFLIGFALVGMFWHGHVRWRRYGAGSGLWSVFLSFALVFLVLVYVYPLRLMAVSLVEYLSGTSTIVVTRAQLGGLFAIYGLGFAAMATTMLLLFLDGRRRAPEASREGMTVDAHLGDPARGRHRIGGGNALPGDRSLCRLRLCAARGDHSTLCDVVRAPRRALKGTGDALI